MRFFPLLLAALSHLAAAQSAAPKDFHLDKSFDLPQGATIELSTRADKITVVGSNRRTVHVTIDRVVHQKGWVYGDKPFSATATLENGKLVIKESPQNAVNIVMVGYFREEYTVKLEMPSDVNLVVTGEDGDYRVENLQAGLYIHADDADIELSRCNGVKELDLHDGELKAIYCAGSLRVKGGDTRIEITRGELNNMEVNVDDGRLVAETTLAQNGRYTIDGNDIPVDFTVLQGGGTFKVRHDGSLHADEWFEPVSTREHFAQFKGSEGTAAVEINVDDGRVTLRHP